MPFSRPTLTEISERIINDFKTRITGAVTFLRRSVLNIMGKVYAGAVHLLYGFLNYSKDQLFASSADSRYLDIIGNEYGIPRTAATYATGNGTATGTAGTNIPAGTELQSGSGNVYETDALYTIGVGGTVTVGFTATVAGDDSNDDGSITLSFVSPISGVNTSVTVDSDGITGGIDEEDDDDYRLRILTRKRQPPHGGAEFDYEVWAKEVSGVTRAWSIPQYQGVGTIGLAFVRDNDTSIIPNETQRQDVYDYIVEHTDTTTGKTVGIPVTAEPGFFVIELIPKTMNFTINVYPFTDDVKDNIETNLEDLILENGGPGETIRLSQISEVIGSASGEDYHVLVYPTTDETAATNEVHVMGTITWGEV